MWPGEPGQTVIRQCKRCASGSGLVIAVLPGRSGCHDAFERLEGKLEQYPAQLTRACVEMAKDWRTDRYLRRLEAMMIVADVNVTLVLTGTGDVLEPERGVTAIGSGGNFALAAARALIDTDMDADHRRRPWLLQLRFVFTPITMSPLKACNDAKQR